MKLVGERKKEAGRTLSHGTFVARADCVMENRVQLLTSNIVCGYDMPHGFKTCSKILRNLLSRTGQS